MVLQPLKSGNFGIKLVVIFDDDLCARHSERVPFALAC